MTGKFGLKRVLKDGREIHLLIDETLSGFCIRAITPIDRLDENFVGGNDFDIEQHRKNVIKERDGCIVSLMGLSEEALVNVLHMYMEIQELRKELQ